MTDRDEGWWREAVIYQIYPRSFQDTDGDGVGDLPGIRQRLAHVAELGADAVWISPIYPSPMADFGYDVADYTGIDPLFGTLDDFDAVLAEAHGLGLKMLLDFVPNHSSDRHPWFTESRSSRENSKRDWYIWRDPAPDGGVPNNWQSSSGGPAWAWDEATGQYYLHKFLPEQPDLNWRNPLVREAMLGAMRFWFERGVDGFRIDVLYHCIKDAAFRDDPENPDYDPETQPPFDAVIPVHSTDQPEIMPLVVEPMRRLAEEMGHRLLVGEIYLPYERLVAYYGDNGSGVHLPFNFALISTTWKAAPLAALIREYESHLPPGGWPNWVLGNHDQSRIATRIGPERAKLAAVLLLAALRGTPTLYYGDELGTEDVAIPPDRVRDPWERNMPGLGEGRDPCRTPMRWDIAPNAGFCAEGVEPWLPVGAHGAEDTVAGQAGCDGSMLELHRALLRLRRAHPALSRGRYERVEAHGSVLVTVRVEGDERVAVAMNLGGETAAAEVGTVAEVLLATHEVELDGPVRLPAGAAAVLRLG
ncbi:alpha-amylase family glycosyl hydrolase [Jannaschia sp. W003]|uniref:alpha-amylase family glycosyl hydrolase n=1 Tax=Jannaschia sp. W003 TaxID=2867012 RepID=UPI0021A3FFF7|nr:alpha-amylase family glycosyl hydrolase [Jannaschia sp. W003]UWQ19965.1 DUF3459 domain-containing protein [Jannaschia sp. W003]